MKLVGAVFLVVFISKAFKGNIYFCIDIIHECATNINQLKMILCSLLEQMKDTCPYKLVWIV